MKSRSIQPERFDIIVFEAFEFKGQRRHKSYRVGSAAKSPKGGYILYIPAGIALTGRVMMVPEKTPLNEVDLLEAYHSAAEEFGV